MSRKISELDKAELSRLETVVAKAELALSFQSAATPDEVAKLRREIQSSKQQIGQIEVEWHLRDQQAEFSDREQMMFAVLVAKETGLNSEERQQYGEFLKEKYFTRSDFNALAYFYSHSWDKLTEGGREQMSHRIWAGVRHGEYTFQELPDVVKEKEAKGLYEQLLNAKRSSPELLAIPSEDRSAFLAAWANTDRKKAYEILDRPSFKENVATTVPQSVKSESAGIEKPLSAERTIQSEQRAPDSAKSRLTAGVNGAEEFKLDDLQLAETNTTQVTPPLPGGGGPRVR